MKKSKLVLPCLRGVLGNWVYYSSMLNAKQIHEYVESSKAIRESKKLDDDLQRDLKERKHDIKKYLLTDESRFFNTIIIGVFDGIPDWIEFDLSKADLYVKNSDSLRDIKSSMGLMVFSGEERMFAIDGQHRVAGIQLAYEEDKDEILKDDQYSVIFIAHIDDALGKKKTRKLFSDINKNAKPVAQGDTIKIDEENLTAIVTRRLYAEYKYFEKGDLIALTEQSNLDSKEKDIEHFTNLIGLDNVNKQLKKIFTIKEGTKEWDEENVKIFLKITIEFYDFIIENISDYNKYFVKRSVDLKIVRKNNSHLLFRPIGLILIAKLYVFFYKKNKLDFFKNNINKISFKFPNSPFDNVLWNKGKIESKNQSLAYQLSLYLLRQIPLNKTSELKDKYLQVIKKKRGKLPARLSETK